MDSDLITVMTRSEIESDLRLGLLRRLKGLSLKPSPPKGIATRLGWLPTSAHDEFLRILRQVTSDIHAPTHAIG
jgi:LysR family transcriptional regulator of gallate degradation